MLDIVLASQSPRRQELLEGAGFLIRVSPVKVSENIEQNLTPEQNASQIATTKVQAYFDQYKPSKTDQILVLGADTIVVLGDDILGKPANSSTAREFLRRLSGKTHRVITGLTLISGDQSRRWSGFDETKVVFRDLTEREIDAYVATGEPLDRAGAYAIQGGGGKFVSSYSGSWSNVVGLPLELLDRALKENGWSVRRRSP